MRRFTLAALLCAGPFSALAVPVTTSLALIPPGEFNAIGIKINVMGVGSDTDTTNLSGNVEVRLNVLQRLDPAEDAVSEMTIVSGNVTGTGVSFAAANFAASYNISATSIGATLATLDPPGVGVVDPLTGDFDASQHTFTVNSGTLTGTYRILLTTESIAADFADNPVGGPGTGEGHVDLVWTSSTATTRTYDVTVTIPVDFMSTFPATDAVDVDVEAGGTVKAAGTITVPINPYAIWADVNGIPGALFDGDENGDGVANGLQWALGLAAADAPRPHLLRPAAGGFELVLPAGGSAGVLRVLGSDDPGTGAFVPLDSGAVSAGNPIPVGTSGTVTVDTGSAATGYLRLEASEVP